MKRLKIDKKYILLISYLLAGMMVVSTILTLQTSSKTYGKYYDTQIKASNIAKQSMDALKEEKKNVCATYDYGDFYESYNDEKNYDSYDCGMIGASLTSITTTAGNLDSKKTSINPNFAAVYISMFRDAGLKKGDQIAINMSGSFPMLNISALSAAQEYGLETCVMSSIGSSSYGANNPAFTFFDMMNYLNKEGILNKKIDYVSFGGADDTGYEFHEVRDEILERINDGDATFICEKDYKTNIKKRINYIYDKCPKLKLFINVGGNSVGLGLDEDSYISKNGYIKANSSNRRKKQGDNIGLIDSFLNDDIDIIQMLNIKSIARKYEIDYSPSSIPNVGTSNAYYVESYNLAYIISSFTICTPLLVYYYIDRRKKELEK